MNWKKLTGQDGDPVFVNLDNVAHLKPDLHDPVYPSRGITGRTYIEFVGGRGNGVVSSIVVRETPASILNGVIVE
jgi:hypothetical protein